MTQFMSNILKFRTICSTYYHIHALPHGNTIIFRIKQQVNHGYQSIAMY
jgi:hypothetical protein